MLTAKLTSKGQVTIPKRVRNRIGVSPGENLQFEEKGGLFYIKKGIRKSPFDKWVEYLKKGARKDSDTIVNEMMGNDNCSRHKHSS